MSERSESFVSHQSAETANVSVKDAVGVSTFNEFRKKYGYVLQKTAPS